MFVLLRVNFPGVGVASPMLTAYWLDDMVIILTDPDKKLIGIGILNTVTCISNKVSALTRIQTNRSIVIDH